MSYADPELRRWAKRMSQRNRQHPNWRQTVVDCCLMCCAPGPDGLPCGATHGLEFHAPEGEANGNNRILLCRTHHMLEHPERQLDLMTNPEYQFHVSRLAEDVDFEVWKCGGLENWMKKFGLKDTWGSRLPGVVDSKKMLELAGVG